MNELKHNGKKLFYWIMLGTALIIIYKAIDQLPNIAEAIGVFFGAISPIIAGAFIAYVLYMPCKKVEKWFKKSKFQVLRKRARALSILIVYVIVILLLFVVIKAVAPVVMESLAELVNNLEGYVRTVIDNYNNLPEDSFFKNRLFGTVTQYFSNFNIMDYVNINNITEYAKGAIEVFKGVFQVFVALIVSIYALSERNRITNFIKKLSKATLNEHTYKTLAKYFNSANKIFTRFISSQLLDAIVVSILTTIALSIMNIKYAPLLGLTIGLFNIIPYIGAIIGVAIATIITFITGGLTQMIWMLVVTVILQQIDANIINPKIVGSSLKISPLLVIVAVLIGGKYFGMVGMFLSVPICALIKIIMEDYIDYQMKRKKLEEKQQSTVY